MNYGLSEILEGVRRVLRPLPFITYRPLGSWRDALPKYENQTTKIGEETKGCTVWGWQNAFEIFKKGVYGVEPNYSERFTYLLAGISPEKGVDPNVTLGAILDYGLIDDEDMPMTRTLKEFTDRTGLTPARLAKGKKWLAQNEVVAEELWNKYTKPKNYKEVIKKNLKRCPVPMSVSAWREVDGVYVSDKGSVNNHFCVGFEVIDYKQYKDCVVAFDTYDHSIKILHPDHEIRRAFAFWINERTPKAMKKHVGILQMILNFLKK